MALVYVQLNGTLGVFLRDVHDVPPQGYGYLLSLNALMVVLMQFAITRRISHRPEFVMLALGAALTGLGFGLYGFVSAFGGFAVAMAILTLGEMVWVPVGQALVARLAPADMRGRYMATFGYAWTVAGIIGPLMAGLLMDSGHATWLWYLSLLLGAASAATFLYLHSVDRQRRTVPAVATADVP
jgi:MFS family permease